MTTTISLRDFEDNLSFWINGTLPRHEAYEMEQFLAANPNAKSLIAFERSIQESMTSERSPLGADQSWEQLKPRLQFITQAQQHLVQTSKKRLNFWSRIRDVLHNSGQPLGYALGVICFVQAAAIFLVTQERHDEPWSQSRSLNVENIATIRCRALPNTTVRQLLVALRATGVHLVSGPNAESELLLVAVDPKTINVAIQQMMATGLFEYVIAIQPRTTPSGYR